MFLSKYELVYKKDPIEFRPALGYFYPCSLLKVFCIHEQICAKGKLLEIHRIKETERLRDERMLEEEIKIFFSVYCERIKFAQNIFHFEEEQIQIYKETVGLFSLS